MKIGLDLRMLSGGSGVSRYISELTSQVLELDKNNQYVLFFKELDENSKPYEKFGQKMVKTGIPHYSFLEQSKLPSILNKEKLDLVHFPHFNVPLVYRKPFLFTIHYLTHTLFPGRKKSHMIHRLAYNMVFASAIKNSKKIIAVSNSTKNDIVNHFSVDESKIKVIYEATSRKYSMINRDDAAIEVFKKFGINKPFILFVGEWRRYKNLPSLAYAFDKLINDGHDIYLVLAGKEDPFYPEIKQQIFSIKHKDRVKALGRVSDEDFNFLYNPCQLFALPSLAEGFGLIALEAATCGTALAISDIPTLREMMGSGAVYFDPNNVGNIADTLDELLRNAQKREDLANAALRRTQYFSWKKAASETIELYESALK